MKSILLAMAVGGIFALSSCSNEEPPAEKPLRVVDVVAAAKKPVGRGSVITGEVRARVQTDLSFRVSGKITERLVDVGTPVKAGQLLARIDPEEQKADIDVAVANLQSAEAQMTQAQLAFDRQQSLFKTQVTSRSAVDKAQETLLTTQGAVRSAQAQPGYGARCTFLHRTQGRCGWCDHRAQCRGRPGGAGRSARFHAGA